MGNDIQQVGALGSLPALANARHRWVDPRADKPPVAPDLPCVFHLTSEPSPPPLEAERITR